MAGRKVVVNASPLILLFNSDLAFILPQLFSETTAAQVPQGGSKAAQVFALQVLARIISPSV